MQIWGKTLSLNYNILRQKSGLWSLKTGGPLIQVTTIVITLGMIWKWSLNTGGLLIEVVIRSGLTVFVKKKAVGSGQQQFGKSNKMILTLRPDCLLTSRFELIIFSCILKDRIVLKERERENAPAHVAEDQMVDALAILYIVNCTVFQDIEIAAHVELSRI